MRVRLKPRPFRAALARRNLALASFARLVGTTPEYLSQLVAGTRNPGPMTRSRILAALSGTRFEDLFVIEDRRIGGRPNGQARPGEFAPGGVS